MDIHKNESDCIHKLKEQFISQIKNFSNNSNIEISNNYEDTTNVINLDKNANIYVLCSLLTVKNEYIESNYSMNTIEFFHFPGFVSKTKIVSKIGKGDNNVYVIIALLAKGIYLDNVDEIDNNKQKGCMVNIIKDNIADNKIMWNKVLLEVLKVPFLKNKLGIIIEQLIYDNIIDKYLEKLVL